MLDIDQVKELEAKVAKAIQLIQSFKDENELLKLEMTDKQKRIEELENIILVFKSDQAKIEEGIVNALNHLSAFEDSVYQAAGTSNACSSDSCSENSECSDTQSEYEHTENSEAHQAENV